MSTAQKIRIDKWLWHARFFKSRGLAADVVGSGSVRVNGSRIAKPAHGVQPGDVLTFPAGRQVRVIRIEALGSRRGPAMEAQTLYTDLAPPEAMPARAEERAPGEGRPTKRARREIDTFRRGQP